MNKKTQNMPQFMKTKKIKAKKREDFREWLEINYDKEKSVEIILYKRHTGRQAPSQRELMEEAICFGWIDTTIHRIDDKRYIRKFVRRNKNSKWSKNTLRIAKQLIKESKMTEDGILFYKLGLRTFGAKRKFDKLRNIKNLI
jgi:uncharacterized protein YdeI (YjbR/CyaY-like superfamily)